jgi:hypothetical protein
MAAVYHAAAAKAPGAEDGYTLHDVEFRTLHSDARKL